MDDKLLDSLAVPTGEAGWPVLGDWLCNSYGLWCCVSEAFSYPEDEEPKIFEIYYCGKAHSGHHHVQLSEGPLGFAKRFPKHVVTSKLLAELIELREYIKQVAPLAHIHGFKWTPRSGV